MRGVLGRVSVVIGRSVPLVRLLTGPPTVPTTTIRMALSAILSVVGVVVVPVSIRLVTWWQGRSLIGTLVRLCARETRPSVWRGGRCVSATSVGEETVKRVNCQAASLNEELLSRLYCAIYSDQNIETKFVRRVEHEANIKSCRNHPNLSLFIKKKMYRKTYNLPLFSLKRADYPNLTFWSHKGLRNHRFSLKIWTKSCRSVLEYQNYWREEKGRGERGEGRRGGGGGGSPGSAHKPRPRCGRNQLRAASRGLTRSFCALIGPAGHAGSCTGSCPRSACTESGCRSLPVSAHEGEVWKEREISQDVMWLTMAWARLPRTRVHASCSG